MIWIIDKLAGFQHDSMKVIDKTGWNYIVYILFASNNAYRLYLRTTRKTNTFASLKPLQRSILCLRLKEKEMWWKCIICGPYQYIYIYIYIVGFGKQYHFIPAWIAVVFGRNYKFSCKAIVYILKSLTPNTMSPRRLVNVSIFNLFIKNTIHYQQSHLTRFAAISISLIDSQTFIHYFTEMVEIHGVVLEFGKLDLGTHRLVTRDTWSNVPVNFPFRIQQETIPRFFPE